MKCCICKNEITGWGNNPWPISEDQDGNEFDIDFMKSEDYVCCDECNSVYVIAARLAKIMGVD